MPTVSRDPRRRPAETTSPLAQPAEQRVLPMELPIGESAHRRDRRVGDHRPTVHDEHGQERACPRAPRRPGRRHRDPDLERARADQREADDWRAPGDPLEIARKMRDNAERVVKPGKVSSPAPRSVRWPGGPGEAKALPRTAARAGSATGRDVSFDRVPVSFRFRP